MKRKYHLLHFIFRTLGKSGHLLRFEMVLKHCVIYFEIPISASQIFRGKKTFKMGKWLWHQRDFLPRRKPGKRVAWRGKAGARKAHFKVNYRGNPARRILTFASQVSSKVNVGKSYKLLKGTLNVFLESPQSLKIKEKVSFYNYLFSGQNFIKNAKTVGFDNLKLAVK